MHPAKIEIDFRLVTLKVHKGNATKNSQVVIKLLHPKKQNNQVDLLPIINDNKLLYKN